MTPKQLEKLGIIAEGKLKPNKYWCNAIQDYLTIYKTDTIEDIFEKIYKVAEANGIIEGKRQRSNEFKVLMDNDDLY
jgi:hypothetical protein